MTCYDAWRSFIGIFRSYLLKCYVCRTDCQRTTPNSFFPESSKKPGLWQIIAEYTKTTSKCAVKFFTITSSMKTVGSQREIGDRFFFSFAHFLNRVLLAPRLCDSKFCDILALQNWNGGQASSTDACRVGRPRLSAFRRNGWRETVLDFLSNWPEGLWTGRGGLS